MSRFCLISLLKNSHDFGLLSAVTVINLLGCFIAGLFYPLLTQSSIAIKNGLFVGFLGAFTTFSSFAIELLEASLMARWLIFFAQVLGTNLFGFLSCYLGFMSSKWFFS